MLWAMSRRTEEFIAEVRRQLREVSAADALRDPLGALVALVQVGPGSIRAQVLRALAHGIFDESDLLRVERISDLDHVAALVICRLAEEHLACRYSGEEWGAALKAIDEAMAPE